MMSTDLIPNLFAWDNNINYELNIDLTWITAVTWTAVSNCYVTGGFLNTINTNTNCFMRGAYAFTVRGFQQILTRKTGAYTIKI